MSKVLVILFALLLLITGQNIVCFKIDLNQSPDIVK